MPSGFVPEIPTLWRYNQAYTLIAFIIKCLGTHQDPSSGFLPRCCPILLYAWAYPPGAATPQQPRLHSAQSIPVEPSASWESRYPACSSQHGIVPSIPSQPQGKGELLGGWPGDTPARCRRGDRTPQCPGGGWERDDPSSVPEWPAVARSHRAGEGMPAMQNHPRLPGHPVHRGPGGAGGGGVCSSI